MLSYVDETYLEFFENRNLNNIQKILERNLASWRIDDNVKAQFIEDFNDKVTYVNVKNETAIALLDSELHKLHS